MEALQQQVQDLQLQVQDLQQVVQYFCQLVVDSLPHQQQPQQQQAHNRGVGGSSRSSGS
jgi:cell division septum initiation protein DivIVA